MATVVRVHARHATLHAFQPEHVDVEPLHALLVPWREVVEAAARVLIHRPVRGHHGPQHVPLVQFEHLRLLSMFNVAEHVQRIGDWHVAKMTHQFVHPDIGPIEYYVAYRADRGADINEFGVRVFTTRGTLPDKDDPAITYPGWAMLDPRTQGAQLDTLLAMSPNDQRRISLLNSIMDPSSNDYIPWTTFISQDNDGANPPHPTGSFVCLIPDI